MPTAVIGLILYKFIKRYLLGNPLVVVWSLLLGGIFLIVFEIIQKDKDHSLDEISNMPYKKAFLIGVFQTFAVVPGVSRSAATIIGGLLLGLKRKTIVEFSFLLAVPTMLAATVLDLVKTGNVFNLEQVMLLIIGFLVSFVIALMSINFLLKFIKNHNFIIFGVYRVCVGLLYFIIIGNSG